MTTKGCVKIWPLLFSSRNQAWRWWTTTSSPKTTWAAPCCPTKESRAKSRAGSDSRACSHASTANATVRKRMTNSTRGSSPGCPSGTWTVTGPKRINSNARRTSATTNSWNKSAATVPPPLNAEWPKNCRTQSYLKIHTSATQPNNPKVPLHPGHISANGSGWCASTMPKYLDLKKILSNCSKILARVKRAQNYHAHW